MQHAEKQAFFATNEYRRNKMSSKKNNFHIKPRLVNKVHRRKGRALFIVFV